MTFFAQRRGRRCDTRESHEGIAPGSLLLGGLGALALAGCVLPGGTVAEGPTTPAETETVEPADSSDAAPVEPAPVEPTSVEAAVVVVEPPDRCEMFLEDLEAARLLLEGLDGALSSHSERMQALTERLDTPPAPPPVDCPDSAPDDMEIIGSIEWIWMAPPGDHYRARVDSGAETSSLSARDIVEFERDGDDWVRFTFEHEAAEESVEIEQPIVRTIIVRQPGVEVTDRRVVVELDIRLGQRLQRTEFALTDRSRMTYPVLLGRAFIRDLYVIDVARSYTHPRYEASRSP